MKKVFILILLFLTVLPTYSACWEFAKLIYTTDFTEDWGAGGSYGDSTYYFVEKMLYNWSDEGVDGGAILWKTTDQGKTFECKYGYLPDHPTIKVDTIPGVSWTIMKSRKIEILNKDTIYIGTDIQYVIRTYNGGQTWERVSVLANDSIYLEDREYKDFSMHKSGLGIYCYLGIALGDSNERLNIQDSIVLTTDDWKTTKWVNINKMDNKKLMPWRCQIVDSNTIYVICRIDEEACMILAKSTDRGDNWTNIRLPNNPLLLGINFINKQIGWVGGVYYHQLERKYYNNVIFKTIDGGLSWEKQLDDSLFTLGVKRIKFINEQEGFALSGSKKSLGVEKSDMVVYHTKNAGESWEREYPDTLGIRLGTAFDLSASSPNNAYIAIGKCIFRYRANCNLNVDGNELPPMPEELSVYPNPSHKGAFITIESGNTNGEQLENLYIYDMSGNELTKQIEYTKNDSGQLSIKLSNDLSSGAYMIVLQYGINRIKYCKVVIE